MLIVLGICLPVPLFAATGLTIPLPATVERLAAALVPWVETAMVDSNGALLRGTIILAPGELSEAAVPAGPIVSEYRSPTDGSPQGDTGVKATNGTETGVVSNPVSPGTGPATAPEDSTSEPVTNPDPGGEDPGDEPDPIETTVDTVGSTVGTVEDTADEILSPVGGISDTLDGTLTTILPGLGG